MPKKLIGLIIALVALSLFINTVTRSPHKDNPADRRMTSLSTPSVRSVAVKEAPDEGEQPQLPAEDWLIEPGHRLGSITARTTLKDLQTLFGAANVKAGTVPGPEGSEWQGAYLFPDQPTKTVKLIWKENSSPQTVGNAIIEGPTQANAPKSVWHTTENIAIGTPLHTLETLNQGPFTLSGFDWDYGGTILSWGDQGKLRAKFQGNGGLILRLSPSEKANDALRGKMAGDATFSSSNPAMQQLNPTVSQMQVVLQ